MSPEAKKRRDVEFQSRLMAVRQFKKNEDVIYAGGVKATFIKEEVDESKGIVNAIIRTGVRQFPTNPLSLQKAPPKS